MPAVSTSTIARPSISNGVSIASRVVPARSETITRSVPRKRVDERGLADVRAPDHRQAHRLVVLRRRLAPRRAAARPGGRAGRRCRAPARPRRRAARRGRGGGTRAASGRSCGASILLAATTTGSRARRSRSRELLVAGPQAGAGVDHEQRDLRVGERRARLVAGSRRASGSASSRSTPPVSISAKRRPFQSVSSSLRSRVTPGRSCTTASRVCVRRLTSEDLPDVRVADDGDLHAAPISAPRPRAVDDLLDDLLEEQAGGVERDRVGRRLERRALGASRRARRAAPARAGRRRRRRRARARGGGRAPRGSRVEEDLDRGVGRDDRRDVAPLGHPVAACEQLPLLAHERGAHAGIARPPATRPRRPAACGSRR